VGQFERGACECALWRVRGGWRGDVVEVSPRAPSTEEHAPTEYYSYSEEFFFAKKKEK